MSSEQSEETFIYSTMNLTDGNTVLCKVSLTKSLDEFIYAKDMLRVVYIPRENSSPTIGFIPYNPFSASDVVKVMPQQIISISSMKTEYINEYELLCKAFKSEKKSLKSGSDSGESDDSVPDSTRTLH